jgi:hypothetical protein
MLGEAVGKPRPKGEQIAAKIERRKQWGDVVRNLFLLRGKTCDGILSSLLRVLF